MSDFRRTTDQFKVQGNQLLEKVRQIIDEGNARRIIIKTESRTLLEFPLTVGVGGAIAAVVLAPVLAAVGAIAALVSDVEVIVERDADKDGVAEESRSYRPKDVMRDAADRAQDAARSFSGKAQAAAQGTVHTAQQATQPAAPAAASASSDVRDKTIGAQQTASEESDASSWSPTHEERGGQVPPAL